MSGNNQMTLKLFRFAGIDVYLHWSWFLVAAYEISRRGDKYSSLGWNVLEYLALFLIVLLHEFGHSLACRSVGGQANRILLWPLGGVAYVRAPERPGATLWSIAAGPLVNIALIPVLMLLGLLMRHLGATVSMPNAYTLLWSVFLINVTILVFNLMPIYPLDGGQILRSLLWYVIGRANSLITATVIGFSGVVVMVALAIFLKSIWFGILAAFIFMNCWSGLRYALALARVAKAPRREGFICPACKLAPPRGAFWVCGKCKTAFDTFENQATCPACATAYATTHCPECGTNSPLTEWQVVLHSPYGP